MPPGSVSRRLMRRWQRTRAGLYAPRHSLETTSVTWRVRRSDFQPTREARLAVGDSRLSIKERYSTHHEYVMEVTMAAMRLRGQGEVHRVYRRAVSVS